MTDEVRKEIDALDLLMQDHREIESLFRDFNHQRQMGNDTSGVVAAACAEIKHHDTLENDVFYSAIGEIMKDAEAARLLSTAEDEHDTILELIEQLERTVTVHKTRDTRFGIIVEQMSRHILAEETVLFPLVRKLPKAELERISGIMKTRRTATIEAEAVAQ